MALRALLKYIGMKPRNRAQRIQDQVPVVKFEAMAKTQGKQLVACVDNDGYPASLEKRKICVALRDADAEKHGLIRIVDEGLPLSEEFLSRDCFAAVHQRAVLAAA
jgi:hypothetical protein